MVQVTVDDLSALQPALSRLADLDAPARLASGDASVVPGDPDVVANRLGWIGLARPPETLAAQLSGVANAVREAGMTSVVLAGMGGSSLAPEVLARIDRGRSGGLPLAVLDSTHPEAVWANLDPKRLVDGLVIAASKSGGTTETAAFAAQAAASVPSPRHLLAITDPGSDLEARARDEGWRSVVHGLPSVGGRYSALSPFGMLPAALLGLDIMALWGAAAAVAEACEASDLTENPAALLAAFLVTNAEAGRDKATLVATPAMASLGDWVEQLVAESLGKQGRGVVPVVGEPVGSPDAYGPDRVLVETRIGGGAVPGVDAIVAEGVPHAVVSLEDEADLGGAFYLWEFATALAGILMDVNPFDEPDVASAKAATNAALEDVEAGRGLGEVELGDAEALVAGMAPGAHLAVHAWTAPSGPVIDSLARLRTRLREASGCAVTLGVGPRFLHSTGQLHKGGPDAIACLQVVDARLVRGELAGSQVPGRPWDFQTLVSAQAAGDLRALRERGRDVARIEVDPDDIDLLFT